MPIDPLRCSERSKLIDALKQQMQVVAVVEKVFVPLLQKPEPLRKSRD